MRTVATTRTRRFVQYSSAYNAIEFETLYAILILVALIGGVEMRIATYEIAFCFHILLLSLLTVGRFRVSVSPTKENCPGVNQLEGGMLLVPCSTF